MNELIMTMRTTLLLALISCATHALAVLPPTSSATLADHLREVNAQWKRQDPHPSDAWQIVSFQADAERIAVHLHMVSERLAQRHAEGLSARQLDARLSLLRRLHTYADGGTFPQNHLLPYRNPVFIDPKGTACAVGWLMIESGHRDLAERISRAMNLAYVLDMPGTPLWPEIASWATVHGFTVDELAWIQPAYAPNYDWLPLGGGTDGTVTVTRALANGNVLIGGDFTQAGTTTTSKVAIWNGSTFSALGTGLLGTVNCAVEFNGDLYIGGAQLNGWSDLAKWNGSAWSYTTVFDGKYPWISALHVHNGELYAAGAMSGFAGTTDFVQKLTGTTWSPVGSAFNAPVNALASHNGSLIAGGAFTGIISPALPPPVMHVAELEGNEWGQHADGLDANVRALLDVNGTLYAGGDLYANVVPTFGLARIAQSASAWEPLLPNHPTYMTPGAGPIWISCLAAHNDEIYFGGEFNIGQMVGTYGNNLARFYGVPDAVAPMIIVEAPVNGLAVASDQLIAGGAFEVAYPHAITLDLSTGIGTYDHARAVMAPNPATDRITITTAESDLLNGSITITDPGGRAVAAPVVRGTGSITVDVHELHSGVYWIRAQGSAGELVMPFVKQ